jgi:hypothetical protein
MASLVADAIGDTQHLIVRAAFLPLSSVRRNISSTGRGEDFIGLELGQIEI